MIYNKKNKCTSTRNVLLLASSVYELALEPFTVHVINPLGLHVYWCWFCQFLGAQERDDYEINIHIQYIKIVYALRGSTVNQGTVQYVHDSDNISTIDF